MYTFWYKIYLRVATNVSETSCAFHVGKFWYRIILIFNTGEHPK